MSNPRCYRTDGEQKLGMHPKKAKAELWKSNNKDPQSISVIDLTTIIAEVEKK